MNKSEIIKLFSNVNNIYYGHGIGAERQDVINSIFKNGLRCSHERLYFTTVTFGEGSNSLFEEQKENMHNWQHKGSKQIIIASLPKKYNIINVPSGPLYGKENSAFYNYFSQEEADKLGIAQGYYLKPEFVSGVYDANTQTFIKNEKYYENLSAEEQNKLFDEVKKQYIGLLKGSQWTLREYSNILSKLGWENPLTEEEIMQDDRMTFENNELESQTADSVQNDKEVETNVEPKKESNKTKFINGFIQAYNDTETEYQYETRKENEESDIERVQNIINTKGLNRMLTMDLDGKWIGTPKDEDFKVQYSQKQVSAMVRLLKAAELLSNNKKLNPEGINYLERFTSVPDIEYKLKQMYSDLKDENTYMFQLKQESKDNRTNGNIPQYEPTYRESEIIIQDLNEQAKEHINMQNFTMSAGAVGAVGIATGDPSKMALGGKAGHINGKMKRISTNEIGKATINVPIVKKIEAKAKETEDKTNIREGEELDDN